MDGGRRAFLNGPGGQRWLAYELPEKNRHAKHGRGQVQKWFLLRLKDPHRKIDLSSAKTREFRSCEWIPLSELANTTWEVRKPIYEELAAHFTAQPA